jgi:integrase
MTNGIDLDARLTAYLELRRALGAKMDRDAVILRDFVRFSQDRGVAVSITSRMVFDWLEAGKQAGSRTAAQRLSSVRQFLLYVSAALPDTQVPEIRVIAGYKRPTPFVFTAEEMEALLKCAAEFEPGRFSSIVFHTALGLLAATGLRVSEALGLDRSDVMPRSSPDTLLIREAKFYKSLFVPLHQTTAEQLRVYAGHRELMGFGLQTSAFFVSIQWRPARIRYFAAAVPDSHREGLHPAARELQQADDSLPPTHVRRIAAATLARRRRGRRTSVGTPVDVSRTLWLFARPTGT